MNRMLSLVVAGLVVAAVSVSAAPGDVIVRDNFTGTGTAPTTGKIPADLNNRPPDTTNLPGGNWVAGTGWSNGIYNNYAWANADVQVRKSIASAGSYTKPQRITISADVNLGWTSATVRGPGVSGTTNAAYARGVALGFFDVDRFTGAVVNASGTLKFLNHSYWHAPDFITTLAWAGEEPFDPSAWYNLTYTIDTSTGGIMDLEFDGVAYNVSTTAFTNAYTNLAGFYVNSDTGNTYGYVDNFQVMEMIPEPSTLACVAAAGLLALRRRRA